MGQMPKLRGGKLFATVYEELADIVPDGAMSTIEILGAAQALIECASEDYIDVRHPDTICTPTYFSYDVCVAMEKFQGRLLINEHCVADDEPTHLNKIRMPHEVCPSWLA